LKCEAKNVGTPEDHWKDEHDALKSLVVEAFTKTEALKLLSTSRGYGPYYDRARARLQKENAVA
jgi:energy-coupling factor transporter transmembrane protein EcfT